MKMHENPFPPESFAQLRQIPAMIGRGELDLPMGKQSFRALCQMMDDPELVAMGNISTLSKALEVSPPTLTRLAKLLGFKGFPEYQSLFRNHLMEPDRFYSSLAGRLADTKTVPDRDFLHSLAQESKDNISRGLMQLEPENLEKVVDWLANGTRIYVFGYRQSASLASIMSYGLGMIRGNVQQLGAQGHGLSIGLSQIGKNDIVVLFSSSPYSKETVLAARLSHRMHARVIAITDSHLSPLCQWADVSLLLPTETQFYSNSFGAMIFMLEGLMTLTAKKLGNTAIVNLELREALISSLNDQY